ncbi:LysR family transcriptional regulator [Photobacterium nomapromontoriensis]|uniref:LysR family transcriptional regulator n=1 Tax=Photobacterium nomapromontoriensis TaxID=2910237 RepID=UPI003D0F6501
MLNPLWLHTFKTLIDVGHFTQTAEILHMTQPGVSQHIQKLEVACGHSLIKREKKHFTLTEQGRLMYEYALKVAQDEVNLLASLRFDNPYAGQCKLSCSGSLALRLYPPLLSLQQQHPDLAVHLEAAPNQKILQDILADTLDMGIVTHQPNSQRYQSTDIGSEALCLVLPAQYHGSRITPELLQHCGLIDHPDAKHYLALFFDLCGEAAIAGINLETIPTSGYINQLYQILLPVAKGLGFTVLPESAIKHFSQQKELYIVPTAKPVKETLYMVQKRNRDLPHRYQTVATLLRSLLR